MQSRADVMTELALHNHGLNDSESPKSKLEVMATILQTEPCTSRRRFHPSLKMLPQCGNCQRGTRACQFRGIRPVQIIGGSQS
jgi:hypothetical protein